MKAVWSLSISSIASATAFLSAGTVLGGNLIAAPAKFQVADLSLPMAFQARRVTLSWIVIAELGFVAILCITQTIARLGFGKQDIT